MGTEISCVFETFDVAERAAIELRRAVPGVRLLSIGPSDETDRTEEHGSVQAVTVPSWENDAFPDGSGLFDPLPMRGDGLPDDYEPAQRREVTLRLATDDAQTARRAIQFLVSSGARQVRRHDGATWG